MNCLLLHEKKDGIFSHAKSLKAYPSQYTGKSEFVIFREFRNPTHSCQSGLFFKKFNSEKSSSFDARARVALVLKFLFFKLKGP